MNLAVEQLVLATQQQRQREAEQYRLTHPGQRERPSRAGRRRHTWPHPPGSAALTHHGLNRPGVSGDSGLPRVWW